MNPVADWEVKKWIKSRQKHYKEATGDYFMRLREALNRNYQQKLQNLKAKSITVHIESKKDEAQTIRGLSISKVDLPDARLKQRIILIKVSSSQQVASGYIVDISLHEVKIKLNKHLIIEAAATRDEDDETKNQEYNDQQVESSTNNNNNNHNNNLSTPPNTPATTVDHDEGRRIRRRLLGRRTRETEYKIKFDDRDVTETRAQIERALGKFKHLTCSLVLHKCLLGSFTDSSNTKYGKARVVPLEGLIQPKGLQVLAVEQAMRKRISLIEGVAGSGKSIVAVNIACSMSRLRKRKILLCSPLQSSVDKLSQLIALTEGVNVVKLPPSTLSASSRSMLLMQRNDDKYELDKLDFKHLSERLAFDDDNDDLNQDQHFPTTKTKKATSLLDDSYSHDNNNNNNSRRIFSPIRGECSLERLIDFAIYKRISSRLKKLSPNYHGRIPSSLSRKERAAIHLRTVKMVKNSSTWLRLRMKRKILSQADVVCCTLAQAGSQHLRGLRFNMLIIDDAQVASELESLIPLMMKGLKQVTLLGDIRQGIRLARSNGDLPNGNSRSRSNSNKNYPNNKLAVNNNKRAAGRSRRGRKTLRVSQLQKKDKKKEEVKGNRLDVRLDMVQEPGGLFERWLAVGLAPVALKCQYRMHETLANFSNHHFYLSRLKTDSNTNKKLTSEICKYSDRQDNDVGFKWLPNSRCLTAIFNTVNESSSILARLSDILHQLVDIEHVHESNIGIVCNDHHLASLSLLVGSVSVQIGTIEDFVGQEKDFIILLGCETTNHSTNSSKKLASSAIDCNYLTSDCSLHVALTRARLGMFIITDLSIVAPNVSSSHQTTLNRELTPPVDYCKGWLRLVKHYVDNKLVK